MSFRNLFYAASSAMFLVGCTSIQTDVTQDDALSDVQLLAFSQPNITGIVRSESDYANPVFYLAHSNKAAEGTEKLSFACQSRGDLYELSVVLRKTSQEKDVFGIFNHRETSSWTKTEFVLVKGDVVYSSYEISPQSKVLGQSTVLEYAKLCRHFLTVSVSRSPAEPLPRLEPDSPKGTLLPLIIPKPLIKAANRIHFKLN
jgi:hypothetical protein